MFLADDTDLLHGPVDKGGFAVDEGAVYGAEVAGVAGDGAVVAHDEVLVGGDDHLGLGAVVGEAQGDVGLREGLSVDEDAAMVDAELIARGGDDALDVALAVVVGIEEDDDVAAMDIADMIGELVDEEAIFILQLGQHAGAFNAHRLVEKRDDEGGDQDGDDHVAKPGVHGDVRLRGRLGVRRAGGRRLLWVGRGGLLVVHLLCRSRTLGEGLSGAAFKRTCFWCRSVVCLLEGFNRGLARYVLPPKLDRPLEAGLVVLQGQ